MNTKEQIRAEIERRIALLEGIGPNPSEYRSGSMSAYNGILSFIDSLPEQPVEGLEKYLQEYASSAGFDYVDDIEADEPGHRWNDHDVEYAYRDGFIAGVEWGAEHLKR